MSRKKKILAFIDWYLPGYRAGGPITSIKNLISQLSDQFDFYVVTTDTDYHEHNPYNNIQADQWNKLDNCEVLYLSKDKIKASEIRKIIAQTEHDVLYLNSMFSIFFSFLPLFFSRKSSKKVVLAPRGMLAPGALSIKPIKKQIFISLFKFIGLNKRAIFHATNDEEKSQIKKVFPTARIQLAANLPGKVDASSYSGLTKQAGRVKLISIARISPEKNLLFAIELLSKIKGEIVFNVYGTINDTSYYQKIEAAVTNLPSEKKVKFHGAIEPSAISGVLKEAHFLLMPTLGENYGHVIIEALSNGCPVIISDKTPWQNLQEKHIGWDISLSDETKWIRTLQTAVDMDNETYAGMSENAIKFAKEVQDNEELVEKYLSMFS